MVFNRACYFAGGATFWMGSVLQLRLRSRRLYRLHYLTRSAWHDWIAPQAV
jgi:hypothetical protein